MVAPVLVIGSAIFCALSFISAASGKKMSSHFRKIADVAGSGRAIPISETKCKILYIVRDTVDARNIINVLDENKSRIYSFERVKSSTMKKKHTWQLITSNHRTVVGFVCVSTFKYWVEFFHKTETPFRLVKKQRRFASRYQYFRYLKEEHARYRWTRTSMVLDRVTALSDPYQECKQRVAIAHKLDSPYKLAKLRKFNAMRENQFVNYEILYDTTILDREVLISTAFISIMTQWRKAEKSQLPVPASRLHTAKRSSTSKVRFARNTGTAAAESTVLQKIRKLRLIKNISRKLRSGDPITSNYLSQQNQEFSRLQRDWRSTPLRLEPASITPYSFCNVEPSIVYNDPGNCTSYYA